MWIYMYIYIMYMREYIYIYLCVNINIYIYRLYVYVWIHVYIYIYHVYIYIYIYIHADSHIHTVVMTFLTDFSQNWNQTMTDTNDRYVQQRLRCSKLALGRVLWPAHWRRDKTQAFLLELLANKIENIELNRLATSMRQ